MKRIVPLLLIGIMVLSGLGAAAVSKTSETPLEKTETIIFSDPEITTKESYSYVKISNANSWLNTPAHRCFLHRSLPIFSHSELP